MSLDLGPLLGNPKDTATVGTMAAGLVGSEILKIAAEVRVLESKGEKICNLTVGDFKPKEFPIPARLQTLIGEAFQAEKT